MMVEFISVKIDKTGNCFATLDAKEVSLIFRFVGRIGIGIITTFS